MLNAQAAAVIISSFGPAQSFRWQYKRTPWSLFKMSLACCMEPPTFEGLLTAYAVGLPAPFVVASHHWAVLYFIHKVTIIYVLHEKQFLNSVQEEIMAQRSAKSQPTVSQQRRERERAVMTERIMEAARELFVRDGYEAVTLNKIARAIEYSPGIIYQYFKDKQALVTAIVEQDTCALRDNLRDCMNVEDPIERILEMARRYAAWGVSHPNHYRLLLTPPAAWVEQEDELRQKDVSFGEQDALLILLSLVEDVMRQGLLKDKYNNPGLVAATLWAGIHGAVMLEIAMSNADLQLLGTQNMDFQERFATLREAFLDGFLKNSPHA